MSLRIPVTEIVMPLLHIYDYIAVEMEEVRELFDSELYSQEPLVADLLEHIGKFRGKMVRPMLVLLCGKACGEISRDHHVVAVVIEMVHMASLVHDDVLDEADQRRRGQTINSLQGNEAAVMLGDLLFCHAFHLCSSLPSQQSSRLIAATTSSVCEGELMQLFYRGYYDITEKKYLDIIARKTADLFATSCYLGAQVGGAEESICQSLEEYGRNVGIAFQIMDDVTDIVGDEKVIGKTLGGDFAKEKITLPSIHYLSHCDPEEKKQMLELLFCRNDQRNEQYLQLLRQAGSIQYARDRAGQFITEAKKQLPENIDGKLRQALIELASFVIA